ncbi:MAG TPA: NYN domain-containing protein [Thermoflexia bacterium]|nr:NYN domain-containing protein [Thermoflexia bacterium]
MEDENKIVRNRRMAILIDGDNAQPSLIEKMLSETAKYGDVTIRRIYGDWTKPEMKGWQKTLNIHAIQPIQQFRYTTGKNATDSAMIIDAMDILYTSGVSGFCLVSSDSDYTRLATRIREKGIFVMGIGRNMTPRAFVNACNVFVYTDNLQQKPKREHQKIVRKTKSEGPPDPRPLLEQAFEMAVQDDGWASLGPLGQYLRQLDPSFDSRTYGYTQLSQLVRAYQDMFRVRTVRQSGGSSIFYVKIKE